MKKFWILALAACALLVAGTLYAINTTPSDTVELSSEVFAIDGLPTTVLQDASRISDCPRKIFCLDVYDPVTCSNGVTYSNACYAYAACATGCSGGGV